MVLYSTAAILYSTLPNCQAMQTEIVVQMQSRVTAQLPFLSCTVYYLWWFDFKPSFLLYIWNENIDNIILHCPYCTMISGVCHMLGNWKVEWQLYLDRPIVSPIKKHPNTATISTRTLISTLLAQLSTTKQGHIHHSLAPVDNAIQRYTF